MYLCRVLQCRGMDVIAKFERFVQRELPELPTARTLLAVSGGLDSMAMAWLFLDRGWLCGIAHCNFGLRGAASDADEAFVRAFAQAHQLPFHVQRFETRRQAQEWGISIQMAARRLRYGFFEAIAQQEGYGWIATAHQLDDALETLLLNVIQGTGLKGLQGIPLRRDRIVRPLLELSRQELQQWMEQHGRTWREDASNASVKYRRNYLRHRVVPLLRQLNPSLMEGFGRSATFLRAGSAFLRQQVQQQIDQRVRITPVGQVLSLRALRQQRGGLVVLWEWLQPYGFSSAQVTDMWHVRRSGACFCAGQWEVWCHRDELILRRRAEQQLKSLFWSSPHEPLLLPDGRKLCAELSLLPPEQFPADGAQAWLDADKLRWPLRVRRWQAGDRFYPLGMQGHSKKLQDFFTDLKLSVPQKKQAWILESAGQICWVVGYRIDERFKIKTHTQRILHLWVA